MFRIAKLTDYGIVILARLAACARAENGERVPHNAREVAQAVSLPVPVVSKVLKTLARSGVLESMRGSKGGYTLSRRPEDITVSKVIEALEGPLAMTECGLRPQLCQHEGSCAVRGPWQVINEAVQGALEGVTVADLIDPKFPSSLSPLRALQQSHATSHAAAVSPASTRL